MATQKERIEKLEEAVVLLNGDNLLLLNILRIHLGSGKYGFYREGVIAGLKNLPQPELPVEKSTAG